MPNEKLSLIVRQIADTYLREMFLTAYVLMSKPLLSDLFLARTNIRNSMIMKHLDYRSVAVTRH